MASLGDRVVLFGGISDGAHTTTDTWVFDGTTWTRLSFDPPAVAPPARWQASMASLGDKVVLFGGVADVGGGLNDTWLFDGTTWSQVMAAVAPPERSSAAMATFGSAVTLFSGLTNNEAEDTWTFGGTSWTQVTTATSPPARWNSTLAQADQELVLFAGVPALGGYIADTWTFDGKNWTQVTSANSPPTRSDAVMATLP